MLYDLIDEAMKAEILYLFDQHYCLFIPLVPRPIWEISPKQFPDTCCPIPADVEEMAHVNCPYEFLLRRGTCGVSLYICSACSTPLPLRSF
jgi:hypothetical protein